MQSKKAVITGYSSLTYNTLNISIPDITTIKNSVFEEQIESTSMSIESTNVTMINESTVQSVNISNQIRNTVEGILYLYGAPPLILFCIISIIVNIKVLMSVFWIKRPLSPTLYISLSLAGTVILSIYLSIYVICKINVHTQIHIHSGCLSNLIKKFSENSRIFQNFYSKFQIRLEKI